MFLLLYLLTASFIVSRKYVHQVLRKILKFENLNPIHFEIFKNFKRNFETNR